MHSINSVFIMFLYMYLTTFENFEFRKFGKVIFIFNKINFLINNIIIYIMHGIDIKSFFLICFVLFSSELSHRSADFTKIINTAERNVRELL